MHAHTSFKLDSLERERDGGGGEKEKGKGDGVGQGEGGRGRGERGGEGERWQELLFRGWRIHVSLSLDWSDINTETTTTTTLIMNGCEQPETEV